jgi:hypothetical protein
MGQTQCASCLAGPRRRARRSARCQRALPARGRRPGSDLRAALRSRGACRPQKTLRCRRRRNCRRRRCARNAPASTRRAPGPGRCCHRGSPPPCPGCAGTTQSPPWWRWRRGDGRAVRRRGGAATRGGGRSADTRSGGGARRTGGGEVRAGRARAAGTLWQACPCGALAVFSHAQKEVPSARSRGRCTRSRAAAPRWLTPAAR